LADPPSTPARTQARDAHTRARNLSAHINCGEDGSVVVGKILEHDTYAYGFDAQTGEFGNLVTKGIIDPTKVVRIALQDGASIGGLLITTEAMVAEKPKKETPMPAMPPGGGMDY
jgi:chaperonin GroEL